MDAKELHVNRLKGCDSGPHLSAILNRRRLRPSCSSEPKRIRRLTATPYFISERRKPLWRSAVWAMIRELSNSAGLEHLQVHPHSLRHSTGYAMVNGGNDIQLSKVTSATGRYRLRFATPIWIRTDSRGRRFEVRSPFNAQSGASTRGRHSRAKTRPERAARSGKGILECAVER